MNGMNNFDLFFTLWHSSTSLLKICRRWGTFETPGLNPGVRIDAHLAVQGLGVATTSVPTDRLKKSFVKYRGRYILRNPYSLVKNNNRLQIKMYVWKFILNPSKKKDGSSARLAQVGHMNHPPTQKKKMTILFVFLPAHPRSSCRKYFQVKHKSVVIRDKINN